MQFMAVKTIVKLNVINDIYINNYKLYFYRPNVDDKISYKI